MITLRTDELKRYVDLKVKTKSTGENLFIF